MTFVIQGVIRKDFEKNFNFYIKSELLTRGRNSLYT